MTDKQTVDALEEAAINQVKILGREDDGCAEPSDIKKSFKAGSEWQKTQQQSRRFTLEDIGVAFDAGYDRRLWEEGFEDQTIDFKNKEEYIDTLK